MNEPLKAVHDPEENAKLKLVADRIEALCKEADIGGYICLQAQNTGHYRMLLEPSWSCLSLERGEGGAMGVRFKAAVATGGPQEKERAQVTLGMIISLSDMLVTHGGVMSKLATHFALNFGGVDHVSERIEDDNRETGPAGGSPDKPV